MSSPFGTPPAPPPKPAGHSSGVSTPLAGSAPRPPPPIPSQAGTPDRQYGTRQGWPDGTPTLSSMDEIRGPDETWLPDILKDKSTVDLHAILDSPDLQHALVHAPQTRHASIPASTQHLQSLLATNVSLANSLLKTEQHLQSARQHTQSRLLALRALERQWRQRQTEQDAALRDFSASALYQRLAVAVGEQEGLCHALEEGFLEEDGIASEREVGDFVRRVREAKKVGYLRRERKERWDEGRIGGWRG